MKQGKRYAEVAKAVDRQVKYTELDAIQLVKKNATAKFDETVELHIRTGCDGRHADQQVRGSVVLPAGTGKNVRILVFAKDAKADVVIATPDMMGVVGRIGRLLGPKGLMPNPKLGTVTMDVAKAIADTKAGKVEYRLDKANIIHVPVGKASFTEEQLKSNLDALMAAIVKARPSSLKGAYMKSITLTSTMGPGVKLDAVQFGA